MCLPGVSTFEYEIENTPRKINKVWNIFYLPSVKCTSTIWNTHNKKIDQIPSGFTHFLSRSTRKNSN